MNNNAGTKGGAELADLGIFLAVARKRSFRKASIERKMAPSAISHAIKRLEERVGVRLFNRTTRSVSLTDAGERLYAELLPAFDGIDSALDGLNAYRESPFGAVRINLPAAIAPFVLSNVMGPLTRRYPNLHLDIVATDRLVDIVEEGFDAGIRFGESLSEGMIAVRIKPALRYAVIGSPDYLAGRALPTTPHDLHDHSCIRYRFPSGTIFNWGFAKDGSAFDVDVRGALTLDSQQLMVEAALQGCGLAYVWENWVAAHIADGTLIRVLDDWCQPNEDLYLYYPSRRHMSAGLRALINMLKA